MGNDEKTEKATPKKRRDQRKEGNVFQSRDVVNVVFVLVMFYMIGAIFPYMYTVISDFVKKYIERVSTIPNISDEILKDIGLELMLAGAKLILPLGFAGIAVSVIMTGIQTKFLFNTKSLKPKFSKLNPLEGIKRILSLKNILELLKNVIKMVILIICVYTSLIGYVTTISRMLDVEISDAIAETFSLGMSMVVKISLAFIVVAGFDYALQRWDYEKKIKMTKQEVKEEFKQMEGNPEIKGKIRQLQRQMARSRMMQAVPDADVIVRNPTHFAVALRYRTEENSAPVVIAKGQDEIALRIVEVGNENEVVVVENVMLARGLYASCEVGHEVTEEYYGAVAELLVYVYKLKKKI